MHTCRQTRVPRGYGVWGHRDATAGEHSGGNSDRTCPFNPTPTPPAASLLSDAAPEASTPLLPAPYPSADTPPPTSPRTVPLHSCPEPHACPPPSLLRGPSTQGGRQTPSRVAVPHHSWTCHL